MPVKIFVAADGPKTIKMAAQEADGVMVSTGIGAEPQSIQYCYDLVREGAEEVGRDPSEFEVWWVLDGVVAESREIAVSQWGATSAHFLARGSTEGKRIPEEYKAPLKAVHDAWRLSKHSRANPRAGCHGQQARSPRIPDRARWWAIRHNRGYRPWYRESLPGRHAKSGLDPKG